MPSVIAAASEYVPTRVRTRIVVGLSCSFSLGSALCGAIASVVLGPFGWKIVFWIGCLLPLASVPLVVFFFPESPTYLASRGRIAELRAMLARIGPWLRYEPGTAVEPGRPTFPVSALFKSGRALMTSCVWLTYFCSGATLYFLANWLPTLLNSAGFGTRVATLSSSAYQVGGLTGGFLIGALVDRFGAAALSAWLFAAAAGVALVGPGERDGSDDPHGRVPCRRARRRRTERDERLHRRQALSERHPRDGARLGARRASPRRRARRLVGGRLRRRAQPRAARHVPDHRRAGIDLRAGDARHFPPHPAPRRSSAARRDRLIMRAGSRVLIAGAGIAGLTTALALLRRGIDVDLYEQATELRQVGAGVQIGPNGSRVLIDLGLKAAMEAVACEAAGEGGAPLG